MDNRNDADSESIELDLNQVGDLQLFSDSVDELWSEINRYAQLAVDTESVADLIKKASLSHEKLRQLIDAGFVLVGKGDVVVSEEILQMQDHYNQLDRAEVKLRTELENSNPEQEVKTEASHDLSTDQHATTEPVGINLDIKADKDTKPEPSEPIASSVTEESVPLLQAVNNLIKEIDLLVGEYGTERKHKLYLDELVISQDRLKHLLPVLDKQIAVDAEESELPEVEERQIMTVVDEESNNVDVIRQILMVKAKTEGFPFEPFLVNVIQSDTVVSTTAPAVDTSNSLTEDIKSESFEKEAGNRNEKHYDDVGPEKENESLLLDTKKSALLIEEPDEEKKEKTVNITVNISSTNRSLSVRSIRFTPQLVDNIKNSAWVGKLENQDPINQAVEGGNQTGRWQNRYSPLDRIVSKCFKHVKYARLLRERYSSPKVFAKAIETFVNNMESSQLDPIERWLGELPTSAFYHYFDITIREFFDFSKTDSIRDVLESESIRYETFIMWLQILNEAREELDLLDECLFGEAIAYWYIENKVA